MARWGVRVKGFGPLVTLVHKALGGGTGVPPATSVLQVGHLAEQLPALGGAELSGSLSGTL